MSAQEIQDYAEKWHAVHKTFKDDPKCSLDTLYAQNPIVQTVFPRKNGASEQQQHAGSPAAGDPLNPQVLALLQKETGLASKEAWWNIWWLVSKAEQDNDDRAKAFGSADKNVSLFQYADALSYDWKDRGVTIGLVGFTTHDNGKPDGDAQKLFETYAGLGGEDLRGMSKNCAKDKADAEALIKKIKSIGKDPKWIEAQWRCLCVDGGYIRETMKAFKAIGIPKPSALAIATVFDASLNQGHDGKDGGCVNLKKLGVDGKEDETLQKYNAWRRKVAGTNDYNSPAVNGQNRADQFEKLRAGKCYSLEKCDDQIKKAISWEMK